MALLIPSVVRRHLKDAAGFRDARKHAIPWRCPANDEALIGWYDDPNGAPDKHVLFTSKAIYVGNDNAWTCVSFDKVQRYDVVGGKVMSSGVEVTTPEGVQRIPFGGRSGEREQFSDAFALAGLLRVVVLANERQSVR